MPKKGLLIPTTKEVLAASRSTTNVDLVEEMGTPFSMSRVLDNVAQRTQLGTTEEAMLTGIVDIEPFIGTQDPSTVATLIIVRGVLYSELSTDAAAGTTTARVLANGTEVVSMTGNEANSAVSQPVRYEFDVLLRITDSGFAGAWGGMQRTNTAAAYSNLANVRVAAGGTGPFDSPITFEFTLDSTDAGTSNVCTGYMEIAYGLGATEVNQA